MGKGQIDSIGMETGLIVRRKKKERIPSGGMEGREDKNEEEDRWRSTDRHKKGDGGKGNE